LQQLLPGGKAPKSGHVVHVASRKGTNAFGILEGPFSVNGDPPNSWTVKQLEGGLLYTSSGEIKILEDFGPNGSLKVEVPGGQTFWLSLEETDPATRTEVDGVATGNHVWRKLAEDGKTKTGYAFASAKVSKILEGRPGQPQASQSSTFAEAKSWWVGSKEMTRRPGIFGFMGWGGVFVAALGAAGASAPKDVFANMGNSAIDALAGGGESIGCGNASPELLSYFYTPGCKPVTQRTLFSGGIGPFLNMPPEERLALLTTNLDACRMLRNLVKEQKQGSKFSCSGENRASANDVTISAGTTVKTIYQNKTPTNPLPLRLTYENNKPVKLSVGPQDHPLNPTQPLLPDGRPNIRGALTTAAKAAVDTQWPDFSVRLYAAFQAAEECGPTASVKTSQPQTLNSAESTSTSGSEGVK
jgi:hypothetical protein